MKSPIEAMIDANVACLTCGTKGIGNCDCQSKCSCGFWVKKGARCPTLYCEERIKKASDRELIRNLFEYGKDYYLLENDGPAQEKIKRAVGFIRVELLARLSRKGKTNANV